MDLTIVIVSYNTKKLLIECVNSIIKHTRSIEYEIIIVDNASTDGSVTAIKNTKYEVPSKSQASRRMNSKIRIIENEKNVGFGAANNQGMKRSKGKLILLLNSDTKIADNVLGEMVEWMRKNSNVGIATCALEYPDGRVQGTGGYFPTLLRVFSWMIIQDLPLVDKFIKPFHPMKEKSPVKGEDFYTEERDVDWVTGAFFMIKKKVVEDVGYFDEEYFMYTEETDLCYRAKSADWKVKFNPKWRIVHYGGASGTKETAVLGEFKGIKIFYRKHFPKWQYPVLRFILKVGALGRIILFGILEGRRSAKIYAKAFKIA